MTPSASASVASPPHRVTRSATLHRALGGLANVLLTMRMQRLMWLSKKSGVVGLVRGANLRSQATPMEADTRRQLQELFEPDIDKLEGLLERDLGMWQR